MLPFSVAPDGNIEATLELLLGAFDDLLGTHDETSGENMMDKINMFMDEVNTVLGENRSAKHAFSMQLAKHQWISENHCEVRFRPGRNKIFVAPPKQAQQPQRQVGVKWKMQDQWSEWT